ncbi:MAG: diaminopimelate epimerase [Acidimicrobiia bacterium]|nr:diaminopimelate epimerase [Acidimicrobiia bacterium]
MRLTKHHGLGNDFLVALGDLTSTPALARRLCDRRRGIGADGLIIGRPSTTQGADVVMDLRNADGSVAEMSGNGIRCLAHAVVRARGACAAAVAIDTAAGRRGVEVSATEDPDTCLASVEMGAVAAGPSWPAPLDDGLGGLVAGLRRAETADVGNPHLVALVEDPWAIDLAAVGPEVEACFADGVNLEVIAPRGDGDALDLRVWERGVGITEACGTGATAAAVLAHRWGLVGPDVLVHQPGGDVTVVVGTIGATLVGPATYIATIEVTNG